MADKKYSVLAVLQTLKEHSDASHPLLIKDIKYSLKDDYNIDVSEKTIRNDIHALQSFGYEIKYRSSYEREIRHKDGKVLDSKIHKDCYLSGQFSDAEIELLFNVLMKDSSMPPVAYIKLTELLQSLSSTFGFSLHSKSVAINRLDYSNFLILNSNVKDLREAISKHRVVSYNDPGSNYRHYVSPIKLFTDNGCYYLMYCDNSNSERYACREYVRVDQMIDLEVLNGRDYCSFAKKPLSKDFEKKRFKLIDDEDKEITFTCPVRLMPETTDYFGIKGTAVNPRDPKDKHFTATVTAPAKAAFKFAMMYAPDVEILTPASLRKQVKKAFSKAADLNG